MGKEREVGGGEQRTLKPNENECYFQTLSKAAEANNYIKKALCRQVQIG